MKVERLYPFAVTLRACSVQAQDLGETRSPRVVSNGVNAQTQELPIPVAHGKGTLCIVSGARRVKKLRQVISSLASRN